jgi:hypothetical protein
MNNNQNEIKLLEQKFSKHSKIYKGFKNSSVNDQYFNKINNEILLKVNNNKKNNFLNLNPSLGYSLLFIVTFLISLDFFVIDNHKSYSTNTYLFSETSLWIEEEQYISDIELEEVNLDYENYISSEINYDYDSFIANEIKELSVNQINSIYENIKTKKIL